MKRLAFLFLTTIATALWSYEASHFFDEVSGFEIQFPKGFEQTWNMSHTQVGFEMNFFEREDPEGGGAFVAIGKLPLDVFEELDPQDFLEAFGDQFHDMIYENFDTGPWLIRIVNAPNDTYGENKFQQFRIILEDDMNYENSIFFDLHTIVVGEYFYMILTSDIFASEPELNVFSRDILQTVRLR